LGVFLLKQTNPYCPLPLNDLDEKVRKMAEIIIEKPSMQKVIYKLENPSDELAFAYYILFICSNAYAMHQRRTTLEKVYQEYFRELELGMVADLQLMSASGLPLHLEVGLEWEMDS
jgi:hypothetical protein